MEGVTARDSGRGGSGASAPASSIRSTPSASSCAWRASTIPASSRARSGADIYQLTKFKRSNQNTCINQKPIVKKGQRVVKGQVLADGPCTDHRRAGAGPQRAGRLHALARLQLRGRDPGLREAGEGGLLHLDPHRGVRDRRPATPSSVPRRSRATSPTSSESALRNLDESGIIRIGATVKPGDILVGKVTPKGETQLTPEEKLLRAIFGEKAGDVRDASLYCPPGIEGTIVDVKIFSRKGQEKDERAKSIEATQIEKLEKNLSDENPHPHRRAREAPGSASWAARRCRPTCTTSAPTSGCSPRAPSSTATPSSASPPAT